MTKTAQNAQTTRAREAHPTLIALEQILLVQLEQELDLNDPDDLYVYNESKDLLEHVRRTLDYVRQEVSSTEAIQVEEEA
jgi:hypothetical protein